MKILGLDVGEKRIGVAKVDSNTRIAVPVGFLLADGSEWQEIGRLLKMNGTNFVVLGLPRSNEGNETKQSEYVRNFARRLVQEIPGVKVRFQDESLTSVEAEKRLKARKKRYEKGDIDAEAATIILQDFVENLSRTGLSNTPSVNALGANQPSPSAPEDAPQPPLTTASDQEPTKKSSHKLRNISIILSVIVVLGLAGVVGVLKWRDHVRAEREEEYRRQEAAMVAEVFNFTIRPGETIFDIKAELAKIGYSAAEIEEGFSYNYAVEPGMGFLNDRPAGATLEGYLYGETHEFYKGATVREILTVFLRGMGEIISENNLATRYAERGLSLFEGITLASIVQKEAAPPAQPTVAQIFLSRLALGMTLGSDVTVSYALDVVDPDRVTYTDNLAALSIDSCYNTRLHGGLPCGPIANPSLTALLAVAEPSDTSYLYFLTGDDGMMYYGSTESEHNQNITLHCQELCNVSL
ncbi:endolytic transglycosylase MltG [Candidatus Saccharibacteria bacterium]|nr:endolytic transglycosylase MltG [Candidatus Saccharibacteria bacterium]